MEMSFHQFRVVTIAMKVSHLVLNYFYDSFFLQKKDKQNRNTRFNMGHAQKVRRLHI
jgi:hypothetical protein